MESSLYRSAQKGETEDQYHLKTPSTISFNLEEQPGTTPSRPRQDQMSAWRDSLDENVPSKASARAPTPAAPVLPRNPVPPGTRAAGAADSNVDLPDALDRLTEAMSNKLELWQRHLEKLSRELIREVTTVIQKLNSATTAPPLERISERDLYADTLKPFPVPRSVELVPPNLHHTVRARLLSMYMPW
jgi:hypothetical protein